MKDARSIEEDRMDHCYFIRYGLTRQVGRFESPSRRERGETVVIRTHRGTELGEILSEASSTSSDSSPVQPNSARVLRAAGPTDLQNARQAERERPDRFRACRAIFEDGVWPLELIDIEPLLDDRRVVLHYLGPHRLDASGLLAALRSACDLDVLLEPVGRDVPDEPEAPESTCGAGGCGAGGGCGTEGSASHGGCADCGIKDLVKSRRLAPAH